MFGVVRPMITLTNGQDVTAAANVKFMHNDNEVNVGTPLTCLMLD